VCHADTDHEQVRSATDFAQHSLCQDTAVHLRMKSQGLSELFFGVAEGAARCLVVRSGGTVMAQRSEGRAYVLAFLLRGGRRFMAQGRRVTPGCARCFEVGPFVVVRVTDVAKRRCQGLVACRAALPFEGL
jgi:hypothetical protein